MNNRPQKQSMSELKLRRVTEHIQRLRDDLARPRVRVSEAAQSLIRYTRTTKDPLVCVSVFLSHLVRGVRLWSRIGSKWSLRWPLREVHVTIIMLLAPYRVPLRPD